MSRSSNTSPDENAELMRKAATHDDVEAFEQLHQRYAPLLMYMASRRRLDPDLSDDLVQRIFVNLWEKRKNFRGESSFETYLFSMAKRTLSKELHQFRELAEMDVKEHSDYYGGLTQPEADLYLQELINALEAAKARLTEDQRRALEASQSDEAPMDKILEELGCSHKAYKSRLKRARKRLKELLAPFLDGER